MRVKSPLPFRQGLFLTECSVYLLGHRQKPSWCLAVRIIIFMPASLQTLTHCRLSSCVGLKMDGFSVPSPHSLSVKVLTVKCIKAMNSICCQASCCGVGRTFTAFRMSCLVFSSIEAISLVYLEHGLIRQKAQNICPVEKSLPKTK